jgi:hypothetical protein
MVLGAVSISFAEPPASEQASWRLAMERECERYHMDAATVAASMKGEETSVQTRPGRRWWEVLLILAALGVFVLLALDAKRPELAMNLPWMAVLGTASLALLVVTGVMLWRRTRFS